jgi:hypothetical protein
MVAIFAIGLKPGYSTESKRRGMQTCNGPMSNRVATFIRNPAICMPIISMHKHGGKGRTEQSSF